MFNLRHLERCAERPLGKIEWAQIESPTIIQGNKTLLPERKRVQLFGLTMKSSLHDFDCMWEK
ncbi:hypothetical protein NEAUS03_0855 [Nematocida ausubeli]|nr:hypothetical protein NEAUS03_0855 [Nematocida ausubeli]